ncbi:MAG TPA: hypothetical protein VEL68_01210, partial [Thermodesulfobacteriota bacterium]|nr:hypothetical protein [Thermodesulfobacteriota bacterium]
LPGPSGSIFTRRGIRPFSWENNEMNLKKVVTPVKTGVQRLDHPFEQLDSGFRRNDGGKGVLTFSRPSMEPSGTSMIPPEGLGWFME